MSRGGEDEVERTGIRKGSAGCKVLAVGLDGATFRTLTPLIRQGLMPNLERMIGAGVSGELSSVIPTNSASAWASFMTGCMPARHGVFEFRSRRPGDADRKEIVNSGHIRRPTVWSMASQSGRTVGAINVPVTYPPEEVNGFVVTGLLTPVQVGFATHPPDLASELRSAIGRYVVDVEWREYEGAIPALVQSLEAMTDSRRDAALYLMERYRPELLTVVFVAPDRLQHCLWPYLDPALAPSAAHAGENHEAVRRCFSRLDGALGDLVDKAGPEAQVVVFSDHGMQPTDTQFAINEWLERVGLLKRRKAHSALVNALKRVDAPLRSLRRRVPGLANVTGRYHTFSEGAQIDWSRTRAYSYWDSQQGIRVNLASREAEGIVAAGEYEALRSEIRTALADLTEPRTGRKVVAEAWLREECMDGPYAEQAADIVLTAAEGFSTAPAGAHLFEPTGWRSADHSLDGMLVASGPAMRRSQRIGGARLVDLCPTILYLLGCPIPPGLDGRMLSDLVAPELLTSDPPCFVPGEALGGNEERATPGLSDVEERSLEGRLKGLGYL